MSGLAPMLMPGGALDAQMQQLRQPPPLAAPQIQPLTPGQPTSAAAAPAAADPLAPVMARLSGGESGGADPYHETYGGGHFGWQGVPNTGSGKYGDVRSTWDAAAKDWMAAHPGEPAPNFSNPNDQEKVNRQLAVKVYHDKTGRDLVADAKAGKVDYSALAGTWPSLLPKGSAGTTPSFAEFQRQSQSLYDERSADAKKFLAEAEKEPPGSQERHAAMQRAIQNSEDLQKQFLNMMQHPPTEKPADMIKNFGSAATVIAILGGLVSKRPLTASLGAAASAMEAMNTNNHEQFKTAFDTWQKQADMTSRILGIQSQEIRSILDDESLSEHERMDRLNEVYHAYGMQSAADAARMGDWATVYKMQESLQQARDQHDRSVAQIGELAAHAEHERAMTQGGALLDKDTVTAMADQYLAGDKSVLTGLGYGNVGAQNRAAVREAIQSRAREMGMSGRDIATAIAEYQGLTAGERSLGTRTATMGMAVSEAKQLIPQVLSTSAKVDRTEYPTLNRLLLAAQQGTGGQDVVRLGIAINSFINVYARAISPTGVPTVSDKDHARELLDKAWSDGQITAGMDQILKELEAAAQAPGAVRQEFRESGQTGVSQPQIGFHGSSASALPTDLPSPAGHAEGSTAKDDSGNVVAKIVNGQWAAP